MVRKSSPGSGEKCMNEVKTSPPPPGCLQALTWVFQSMNESGRESIAIPLGMDQWG